MALLASPHTFCILSTPCPRALVRSFRPTRVCGEPQHVQCAPPSVQALRRHCGRMLRQSPPIACRAGCSCLQQTAVEAQALFAAPGRQSSRQKIGSGCDAKHCFAWQVGNASAGQRLSLNALKPKVGTLITVVPEQRRGSRHCVLA